MSKTETVVAANVAEETALMVRIALDKLIKNPYRDMKTFPIDEVTKIPSLVESYEKTGVWPGMQARPKDNLVDGKEVSQKQLEALVNSDHDFSDQDWEIPFAHHRLFAAKQCNLTHLPIIIKVMSDEEMLLKMANENKEGYGSSVLAILETVRQVSQNIIDGVEAYETYDDYIDDGGEFFTSATQFKNAKTKGIGWRVVKRFLGATWLDSQVRAPFNALGCIDAGYIQAEQFSSIKSLGHAEVLSGMIKYMYEGGKNEKGEKDPEVIAPDWPSICKAVVIDRCIKLCSKGDKSKTVATLRTAYSKLRKLGVSPATALVSGRATEPFNVYEYAKAEYLYENSEPTTVKGEDDEEDTVVPPDYQGTLELNLAAIELLRNDPEWSDYEDMDDLCDRLTGCANRRSQAGEGVAEEPTAEPIEGDDVDGAVHGDGDSDENLDTGNTTSPESFGGAVEGFMGNVEHTVANLDMILADPEKLVVDEVMSAQLDLMASKIVRLYLVAKGEADFKSLYKSVKDEVAK